MNYDELNPPTDLPEPGFYYHYKHNPEFTGQECRDADIRNYAYLVLPSFGLYTEEDGPADRFRVEYLPLYPWAKVYQISIIVGRVCRDHRPVSMFMEEVKTGTYSGPRFRKIMDPEIVARLKIIYEEMYGVFPQK